MPSETAVDLKSHPLTLGTGSSACPISRVSATAISGRSSTRRLAAHEAEIEAIAGNAEAPTIDNTLAALELVGDALDRVSAIFWCRAGAHTNDADPGARTRHLAEDGAALLGDLDEREAVCAASTTSTSGATRSDSTPRRCACWRSSWKGFVRAGAKLDAGRQEAAGGDQRGACLARRALRPERAGRREASGCCSSTRATLPACRTSCKSAMAQAAEMRGQQGPVTPSRCRVRSTSRSPPSPNAATCAKRPSGPSPRRGENGGATDNREVVRHDAGAARREGQAARLRELRRAEARRHHGQDALGASWRCSSRSGTRRARRRPPTRPSCSASPPPSGSNEKIAAWDWRYYQEKLRAEKYAFDEAELKPYLQLERIIDACFDVANRLFGITFVERKGIPAWHPDVRVFEVQQRRRHAIGRVPRRLFRAAVEALRRLDERAAVRLQAGQGLAARSSTTS